MNNVNPTRERLLQTAHEIEEVNPLLGYDLERRALSTVMEKLITAPASDTQTAIALIRRAHAHPELRSKLLPVIYKLTGR